MKIFPDHLCKFLRFLFFIIFFSLTGFLMQAGAAEKDSGFPSLTPSFHKDRRDLLRSMMPDNSCAVIFPNPERNRSADQDFGYHQNPDFFYLTGLTETNSLLLIFKDEWIVKNRKVHEILFVRDRDEAEEIWVTKHMGLGKTEQISAVELVLSSSEFMEKDYWFNSPSKILYTSFPKGLVNGKNDKADLFDLVEHFKNISEYPSVKHDDYLLGKLLRSMREIKTLEEIEIIRKAADITAEGHLAMMKTVKPGLKEYQVQAAGEYYFKNLGANGPAYPSICGSGPNSCILHYDKNLRTLPSGDLILLDMGAEYNAYAADLTRTLPVNGIFTEVQKKIYNLVLNAQKAAIEACIPGNKFKDPDRIARNILRNGLTEMGILTNAEDLNRYFPHGTSHFLGLDVHDAGTPGTLKPGMVMTIEPGLYFPEGSPCDPIYWNIGVRIEDDILITEQGHENLTVKVPVEISEIETVMKERSIFNEK